jgi:hypothetical protein
MEMPLTEDPRIRRLVEGLAHGDQVQHPPGAPGDPQLAALNQYLQTKATLESDAIIVDFGSGAGMLASAITQVWQGSVSLPWYYAVDRPEFLDALAIPTALHNSSRKVSVDTFLTSGLAAVASQVRIVVLRNVLHELDIATTARLFSALGAHLTSDCEVYIQDYVRLPHGERARAGWSPEVLRSALTGVGFDSTAPVVLRSRSGNQWFFSIARRSGKGLSQHDAEKRIAAAREQQREAVIAELEQLSATSEESTTPDYLILQAEEAALATQLQQWSYRLQRTPVGSSNRKVLVNQVPLVNIPMTPLDYADEINGTRSGLRVVVSSKNLLDFPAILGECRNRAYFAGYSQRSLLLSEQNRVALRHAISAGADLRILLANPSAPAAIARATSLAYSTPSDLTDDIHQTQRAFEQFYAFMGGVLQADLLSTRCRLRLTNAIPPCSYFIVDDLCYVSLYSLRLTGGSGPCLIFRADEDGPSAYFSILLQEFRLAWGTPE